MASLGGRLDFCLWTIYQDNMSTYCWTDDYCDGGRTTVVRQGYDSWLL
jgi:hypothetical protein